MSALALSCHTAKHITNVWEREVKNHFLLKDRMRLGPMIHFREHSCNSTPRQAVGVRWCVAGCDEWPRSGPGTIRGWPLGCPHRFILDGRISYGSDISRCRTHILHSQWLCATLVLCSNFEECPDIGSLRFMNSNNVRTATVSAFRLIERKIELIEWFFECNSSRSRHLYRS